MSFIALVRDELPLLSYTPALISQLFKTSETEYLFQKAFSTMTSEQIEKYVETSKRKHSTVSIHFKDRPTVSGVFIEGNDYSELKSKNLWRIVIETKYSQWKQNKDINLSRIFNGISFTRLSE